MAVPKSDASLLMGLVSNYLLYSGVTPTVSTDPRADVLVYVTVDVFGTVRSRFDALAYNNETVKAETSFEISAFDKDGKMIMRRTVANREAQYRELYLMWAGSFVTTEHDMPGTGFLVNAGRFGRRCQSPSQLPAPWGEVAGTECGETHTNLSADLRINHE